MASTQKRLKDRELLLVVADAAGGTLDGRTVAQKLLYFAGRRLDQPTGHAAYFYGPYSEDFEAAIERAVLADELSEQIERIPDWRGGPDVKKHIYTLTDRGREEAARVAEEKFEEASFVRDAIRVIAEAVPEFRQRTLSAAAKIDLIVHEQDHPVPLDELRQLAQDLGWHLGKQDMNEALDVLARLELVNVE